MRLQGGAKMSYSLEERRTVEEIERKFCESFDAFSLEDFKTSLSLFGSNDFFETTKIFRLSRTDPKQVHPMGHPERAQQLKEAINDYLYVVISSRSEQAERLLLCNKLSEYLAEMYLRFSSFLQSNEELEAEKIPEELVTQLESLPDNLIRVVMKAMDNASLKQFSSANKRLRDVSVELIQERITRSFLKRFLYNSTLLGGWSFRVAIVERYEKKAGLYHQRVLFDKEGRITKLPFSVNESETRYNVDYLADIGFMREKVTRKTAVDTDSSTGLQQEFYAQRQGTRRQFVSGDFVFHMAGKGDNPIRQAMFKKVEKQFGITGEKSNAEWSVFTATIGNTAEDKNKIDDAMSDLLYSFLDFFDNLDQERYNLIMYTDRYPTDDTALKIGSFLFREDVGLQLVQKTAPSLPRWYQYLSRSIWMLIVHGEIFNEITSAAILVEETDASRRSTLEHSLIAWGPKEKYQFSLIVCNLKKHFLNASNIASLLELYKMIPYNESGKEHTDPSNMKTFLDMPSTEFSNNLCFLQVAPTNALVDQLERWLEYVYFYWLRLIKDRGGDDMFDFDFNVILYHPLDVSKPSPFKHILLETPPLSPTTLSPPPPLEF